MEISLTVDFIVFTLMFPKYWKNFYEQKELPLKNT